MQAMTDQIKEVPKMLIRCCRSLHLALLFTKTGGTRARNRDGTLPRQLLANGRFRRGSQGLLEVER